MIIFSNPSLFLRTSHDKWGYECTVEETNPSHIHFPGMCVSPPLYPQILISVSRSKNCTQIKLTHQLLRSMVRQWQKSLQLCWHSQPTTCRTFFHLVRIPVNPAAVISPLISSSVACNYFVLAYIVLLLFMVFQKDEFHSHIDTLGKKYLHLLFIGADCQTNADSEKRCQELFQYFHVMLHKKCSKLEIKL